MEGEGGPTASSSPPSPPAPHDPDFSPVDSLDDTVPGPRAQPSDDDHELELEHENDQDHDHVHGHDQSAGTSGLTEDLKRKIIKQASLFPSTTPIAFFECVCLGLNRRNSLLCFVHQKNVGTCNCNCIMEIGIWKSVHDFIRQSIHTCLSSSL